jgi:hypothetical protein
MSNGSQPPQQLPGAYGFILSHGGRLGAALLAVSAIGHALVSFNVLPVDWFPRVEAIKSVAMAVAILGIVFHSKKATDLYVESEAEKRIANPALTAGPEPSSTVPAIQREIEKRMSR